MKNPIKAFIDNFSCKMQKEDISVITGANDIINDIIFTLALFSKAKIYNIFATYTEKKDIIIKYGTYFIFCCKSLYISLYSYTIIYIMIEHK